MMDVLTNLIVENILQYICVSNHHIVQLELTQICIQWISSRDLMYNMVIIVNNTVLYIWKLLREQILKVLTTGKKMVIMWGDRGVN